MSQIQNTERKTVSNLKLTSDGPSFSDEKLDTEICPCVVSSRTSFFARNLDELEHYSILYEKLESRD